MHEEIGLDELGEACHEDENEHYGCGNPHQELASCLSAMLKHVWDKVEYLVVESRRLLHPVASLDRKANHSA